MTEEAVPPGTPSRLAAALVEAQGRVLSVRKGSRNKFHNYQYVSAEDMLKTCTPALAACGLTLVRLSCRIVGQPYVVDVPGGQGRPARPTTCLPLRSRFRVIHSSGESMDFESDMPAVLEAGRGPDKAVLGTQTEQLSYALRDLLLVARGDETSVSDREDRDEGPAQREPMTPGQMVSHLESLNLADVSPGQLGAWCGSLGRPHPGAMSREQQEQMLQYLRSEKGAAALRAFIADPEPQAPPQTNLHLSDNAVGEGPVKNDTVSSDAVGDLVALASKLRVVKQANPERFAAACKQADISDPDAFHKAGAGKLATLAAMLEVA